MRLVLLFGGLLFFNLLSPLSASAKGSQKDDEKKVILTMGGDVNFNISKQAPLASGVSRFGTMIPWQNISQGILPLITGDLNFANIETVVTDQDLTRVLNYKEYNFQSHVNSIRHLVENNFNLLSLANNHAYDYGHEGYRQTLRQMETLKQQFPNLVYHGVGKDLEDASSPSVFERNGITFAFAAVSMVGNGFNARENSPGLINLYSQDELNRMLRKMREIKADYKIVSIHNGVENYVQLDPGQQRMYNDILRNGDVDLIIGHHPHVVRPIEFVDGKVIVYSLGTYMMLGARSMDDLPTPQNYGLFLRAQIVKDAKSQRARMTFLEATPLRGMEIQPRPMIPSAALERLDYLNRLSLQQLGPQRAAKFEIQNGLGLTKVND